jgi:hypothetical protein
MHTPRHAQRHGHDRELAAARPLAAVGLLVLGANFARYHLFYWAVSACCLAVFTWLYAVPVERRNIDRVRRAHACFYAGMAFFVLQIVSMLLG